MRRRRRNPALSDINTLLIVGVVGVGAYFIWKLMTTGKAAITSAGSAISKAIAPNPTANATIVLSDGTEIPWSAATWRNWIGWFNTLAQFDYNGVGYQLISNTPDETNTYYAAIIASELPPPQTPLTPGEQAIQDQFNVIAQSG